MATMMLNTSVNMTLGGGALADDLPLYAGQSYGNSIYDMSAFMVDPLSTWSWYQTLFLFPALFVIPSEILGVMSSLVIYIYGGKEETDLPYGPYTFAPLTRKSLFYIWFNRLVVLPFLSLLIVKTVWASPQVVYGDDELTWVTGPLMFLVVFSLADLSYYTSHRIVHSSPFLYKIIHKHHHGAGEAIRGWADTCNATPLDFFYTGFCTCPISVLWLMPAGSVHIYSIFACGWANAFMGALGHTRLDLNWHVFDTRFHAGHHGNSSSNFAQNIDLWDRLFGTYRDYGVVVDRVRKAKKVK